MCSSSCSDLKFLYTSRQKFIYVLYCTKYLTDILYAYKGVFFPIKIVSTIIHIIIILELASDFIIIFFFYLKNGKSGNTR